MPVIAFANLKGGVAKTTNAVAVAETLAALGGGRVLVIDADHQCTASALLLGEQGALLVDEQRQTLHHLLVDMLKLDFENNFGRYVVPSRQTRLELWSRLDVLPCSVKIDDFQSNVARARRGTLTGPEFGALWRRRRVAVGRWLQAHYDVVVVDCPPSLTRHVQFLLRIADGIVIPSVPDYLCTRGATQFLERLERHGIETRVLGTLWTLYRVQVPKHRAMVEGGGTSERETRRQLRPFQTVIPHASSIAAAMEPDGQPDSLRAKYTPEFAALYNQLCSELLRRSSGTHRDAA